MYQFPLNTEHENKMEKKHGFDNIIQIYVLTKHNSYYKLTSIEKICQFDLECAATSGTVFDGLPLP